MRLFERHKNGAIIDMDGESTVVASQLVQWRDYQDRVDGKPKIVGFVVEEREIDGDSGTDH